MRSVSQDGFHSSLRRERMAFSSSRSVPVRRFEQRLCLTALREEAALPASVRGPVEALLGDSAESAADSAHLRAEAALWRAMRCLRRSRRFMYRHSLAWGA